MWTRLLSRLVCQAYFRPTDFRTHDLPCDILAYACCADVMSPIGPIVLDTGIIYRPSCYSFVEYFMYHPI